MDNNIESLTLFCSNIDDITPSKERDGDDMLLEVTLSEVDLQELISEVGVDIILSGISNEDIQAYLKEGKEDATN